MYIEILSVSKKKEQDLLPDREDELRLHLAKYGYTLNAVKKTIMHPTLINNALNAIALTKDKPDVVIIANALRTKDESSFKKYFVETVAAAERAVNVPAPKDYWKNRNKAFAQAKAEHADEEKLAELEKEYTLQRKKAKVFSLGDFGEGYRGYCFIYKDMRVAVVPQAELTGNDFGQVAALAAVRTTEIYENSANDYPDGFGVADYIPPKTGFVNTFIPLRGDDKKEIGRKMVVIGAFLVFVAALGLLFYNMVFLSIKNTQLNGEIQRIAHGADRAEDDHAPDVEDGIDWDELQSINPEIVGWIYINDTKIDYPVLWHKGDDMYSQYYLNHNYKGDWDSYGTIFLDYRATDGTDSKNVVMHGHHMNDGSMFGNLMNYAGMSGNLDFYKEAPVVEFDTPKANGKYKIISIFKTNTLSSQGEFFNYLRCCDFQNDKDFMNYVYNVRIRSLINCPVTVNEDDELITLSTCSYEFTNFRTVVVARRVRIGEDAEVDVDKAEINDNAVWPQVYYNSRGGTRPKVTDFSTAYEAKEIDWYDGKYDFKDQKVTSTTDDDTTADGTKKTDAPTEPPTELRIFHTVTFINYDGSEISSQEVEDGLPATAPPDPVKPSDDFYDYVFKGWQLDFDVVQTDMIIAPNFEPVLKPEFRTSE
ncbi:MAG: class B sortase [Ruminococcus sp.]|nr:class B sortase [uncultured Ruminococcus sp.]MBQ2470655.1 class B sortase [Ruminococcus sp.]MBQ4170806.1 class B sortase [Ruminococcus sp.]SCX05355.1 sortase B [Ruminococcaceae bacterium P7]